MKKKTEDPNKNKLKESIDALNHALKFASKIHEDRFYFSGISKSFEVCLEYTWKYFKRKATNEGLEVFSPKDAIKIAGKMNLIDDVERWLDFLEDRNLAVHDYLGIPDEDYLKTIKAFLIEVKKLI